MGAAPTPPKPSWYGPGEKRRDGAVDRMLDAAPTPRYYGPDVRPDGVIAKMLDKPPEEKVPWVVVETTLQDRLIVTGPYTVDEAEAEARSSFTRATVSRRAVRLECPA